jgi:hypothetical protein
MTRAATETTNAGCSGPSSLFAPSGANPAERRRLLDAYWLPRELVIARPSRNDALSGPWSDWRCASAPAFAEARTPTNHNTRSKEIDNGYSNEL